MWLSVINGSPRGKKSNTAILLGELLKGFCSVTGSFQLEEIYLNRPVKDGRLDQLFHESDIMIIAFPLYTDAMPGIVKEFFEDLSGLCGTNPALKLGFIVQSGFPEAIHSRFIARYLERLASRLGAQYLGTAIRGGVEGIQVQPAWMTRRIRKLFWKLGAGLALNSEFDDAVLLSLAQPERLGAFVRFIYTTGARLGLTDFYWNRILRENNAWQRRFDRSYMIS
ncbi:MAG: flavodoxin family protein [Bacteroidales bacterium]|nr:flavodoxin family protein [Bacteroidales bacterium]